MAEKEALAMEVGVDTSRRVEVKLRPGPKRRMDGELSPAVILTKERIAEVAWRLALDGTWPSPKSVGEAGEGLTKDNVAHHRDALEAARLKWNELHGPHSHWKAPRRVADEGHAGAAPVAAGGSGEGADRDRTADEAGGTMAGASGAADADGSIPAAGGASAAAAHAPGQVSELAARIDELETQLAACKADLDKELRRVRRLEQDVEDREARIEVLDETLDNLRDLNARLMLKLRKDLPVYDNLGGPPPV